MPTGAHAYRLHRLLADNAELSARGYSFERFWRTGGVVVLRRSAFRGVWRPWLERYYWIPAGTAAPATVAETAEAALAVMLGSRA